MATIIDALIVTLGLDSAGMTQGAKDAEGSLKKIEEASKRASEQLQKQQDADAESFKKRQRAESDAFRKQQQSEVASGKLSKQASLDATKLFQRKQTDESSAFKKSQQQQQKDFKQGWADRIKSAKEEEAHNKSRGDALSKLRGEFLGLAAIIGGLKLGAKMVEMDTQIGRTAQSLGVSTTELNNWQMAAERVGVSAEEMAGAFRTSNQFQADLATGSEDAIKKLNDFVSTVQGLSSISGNPIQANWAKFADKNLTSQERLIEVSKILSQLSSKDASLAAAKLGYAEDTARFLHQGVEAIEDQKKEAADLDPFMQSASDKSEKLTQSWVKLRQAMKGAGNDLVDAFAPAVEAIFDTTTKLLKVLTDFDAGKTDIQNKKKEDFTFSEKALVVGLTYLGIPVENKNFGKKSDSESEIDFGIEPAAKAWVPSNSPTVPITPSTQNRDIDFGEGATSTPSPNTKQAVADVKKSAGAAGLSYDLTKGVPQAVIDAALKSQEKYNVPAAVTIAQWRLESSNGKKMPAGSNNPFGIKAKAGQPFVEAMTTEFKNGVEMHMMQKFAKFDSLDDAFEQHAKLLATSKYYEKAREHVDDPNAYADALTGEYATDPKYGAKLKNLMAGSSGTSMPGGAAMAANASNTSTRSNSTTSVQTTVGNVTVNAPNAKTNADVATAIKDKLSTYTYAANANVGLQ